MSCTRKSLGGLVTVAVAAASLTAFAFTTTVEAQLPELWVRVADTTAPSGAQNTVIAIYMNNYQDTVAGFNLYIQLDRPDIMEFQTDSGIAIDTTCWKCTEWSGPNCVDSVIVPTDTTGAYVCDPAWGADFYYIDTSDVLIGNFDSAGTLCSGWAMVDARSLSGSGYDLNIAGLAFTQNDTDVVGIPPQQGGLLIKVLADVYQIPDTMQDRTANIMIQHDVLDHYSFSRPDGSSIGIVYDIVPDTNCWMCTVWIIPNEVCGNWERVSVPPGGDYANCDSIEIEMDSVPRVDTNTVTLLDGSLTVLAYLCGDCDASGQVNVADLTYLVAYLLQGGAAPIPPASGDMDCAGTPGEPNVADLTYLVAYLFQGGAAPCEGC
ncbi:MAG: hypothetical protein AB1744_09520 [Candidatus Zixiibacteriota bacterium]